ncbi:hypothetical protein Patl1_18810 [Pistacia atlantica]|uniref:Uncharacterized protein n=1 Tax=Pistacia atlantica TaxID=434234 RepID=A0ACC1C2Z3_9ROSI|nr:hypothetical protein Patl1_18810 [Pistacia atlantica]
MNALEPSAALHARNNCDSKKHDNGDVLYGGRNDSRGHEYEISKLSMLKQWSQFERPDSFDASDGYHSQELSLALYQREEMASKRNNLLGSRQSWVMTNRMVVIVVLDVAVYGWRLKHWSWEEGYQDQGDKVEFSGPLLSQSNRIDELLERHERHIRQAVRKSWFQRGKKSGK